MLDLLDFDRLEEILVLIIPGFVSLKVWTLINPTARLKLADYLLDIIAFSTLNFVALSWLLLMVDQSSSVPQLVRIVVRIAVFVVFPAAWPVLLRAILSSGLLRGHIINPVPLAWDHFFGKGEQKGYTPKASLSPDKIVPPKGGTGETTLATRPPSADNPPSPPPMKD